MSEELCSPHPCRRQDRTCQNVRHSKSKGLCATCFNHGCVADRVITSMSDATNDTTRTAADRVRFYILQRMEMRGLDPEVLHALHSGTEREAELRTSDLLALLSDLDRLAGPVCDHPPCNGARAIEHYQGGSDDCMDTTEDGKPCGLPVNWYIHDVGAVADGYGHRFMANDHPPYPSIEAWLRARSAK